MSGKTLNNGYKIYLTNPIIGSSELHLTERDETIYTNFHLEKDLIKNGLYKSQCLSVTMDE